MSDGATTQGRPPRGPSLLTLGVGAGIALLTLVAGVLIGPPIKDWAEARRAAEVNDPAAGGTWYISQMHPWIIQPEPGNCPICGMDLTPVDPARFAGEITIDPVVVQNIGIRVVAAERAALRRSLRTIGTVALDEGRVTDVVQRFGGWVDAVAVGARWARVEKGEALFSIYAPQVLTAEEEWLIAARGDNDRLAEATWRRLELLGLPENELDRLRAERSATDTVAVRAPVTGWVWRKNVNRGSEIKANTVAYQLVELDQVWVEATVYEDQLPFFQAQPEARITLDQAPGNEFAGRMDQIYPQVDAATRELQVRFVVDNRPGPTGPLLKPGMFTTVQLEATLAEEAVVIPQEAVIGTGERQVVFISLGRGRFEPRDVALGPLGADNLVAVRSGVEAGEQVVVSGQFLLDSESRMREALAKVMQGDLASKQAPAAKPAGDMAELPVEAQGAWGELIDAYLQVQDQLFRGQEPAAAALREATAAFMQAGRWADEHFHHRHPVVTRLTEQADALQPGDEFAAAFGAFSITLDEVVKRFGSPSANPLQGLRCGMAAGIPEKGVWLQRAGEKPRNPYFGAEHGMAACAMEQWPLVGTASPDGE